MTMRELMAEARRLAILQLLADDPDEAINDGLMHTALTALGHGVHPDVVAADLKLLADHGLIELEELKKSMLLARLTEYGANVAKGHATVPGVKRYRPS